MINKNFAIIDNELYNIVKGEITVINNNGTYDVKISHTKFEYPHVKNVGCKKIFKMGDIVNVGLEHESKKLPIIVS
ncbi:hypothetical protein KAX02_00550 [candidate division WOR-3 bacterium]|nr:hypothetical protein [candidate division WOR-3 bacterium]